MEKLESKGAWLAGESRDFGLYGEVVSGDNVGVKKALGYLAKLHEVTDRICKEKIESFV